MALIRELKRNGFAQVSERLHIYEQMITEAAPIFDLKGKSLEQINREHAQNLMIYGVMLEESKSVEDFLKSKMEETEAKLYRKYVESSARALSATDLKMYVRGDDEYVEANQSLLDVAYVRKQLEAIVEALRTMGWSLSNIVKMRVAQLEDATL
jgi:hypothetical protein